jgi:Protein of unknown function (DUF1566)
MRRRRLARMLLSTLLLTVPCLPLHAACTAGSPNAAIPESTPTSAFVDNGDGTVTHTLTNLTWAKCADGKSGAACDVGFLQSVGWQNALARVVAANAASFLGHSDWRMPNIKELESIVENCGLNPAINQVVFPGAAQDLSSQYWSSTLDVQTVGKVWYVLFGEGATSTNFRFSLYALRLVRGGQAADAFDLFPPPPPPIVQGTVSRKAHAGAGTFDLPLAP